MNLLEIGRTVRASREKLGLSQERLAHLSGLSRQSIVGLETGTLNDLGINKVSKVLAILGIQVSTTSGPGHSSSKNALWMAAKNVSVSHAKELSPEALSKVLASGVVPESYIAHVVYLLDETPLPTVVMAVREAAEAEHVPASQVWKNVTKLARKLSTYRQDVWL